jgi:hypothetical protein
MLHWLLSTPNEYFLHIWHRVLSFVGGLDQPICVHQNSSHFSVNNRSRIA